MNQSLEYADHHIPVARAARPWLRPALVGGGLILLMLAAGVVFYFALSPTAARTGIEVYGGVWHTPSYGGRQEIGRGARITVHLVTPGSPEEVSWAAPVNAALARACQQIGSTDAPPTVWASPVSVKLADEIMRLTYGMARSSGLRWNDLCAVEFVSFLDDKTQKVADTTADIDGKYRLTLPPLQAGKSYVILARDGRACWAELVTQPGRVDLNDAALLRER